MNVLRLVLRKQRLRLGRLNLKNLRRGFSVLLKGAQNVHSLANNLRAVIHTSRFIGTHAASDQCYPTNHLIGQEIKLLKTDKILIFKQTKLNSNHRFPSKVKKKAKILELA